jgi:hypothetical protein
MYDMFTIYVSYILVVNVADSTYQFRLTFCFSPNCGHSEHLQAIYAPRCGHRSTNARR